MKLLGHILIAVKSFPELKKDLISLGSILPETIFYIKDPALTFEQIHEGGLTLYKFCINNHPNYTDLAVGVMTHSVKYGADKFDSLESVKFLGYEENDLPLIAKALGVEEKVAIARAHNLYDLALDYFINKNYPETKGCVDSVKLMNKRAVSDLLGACYEVSSTQVEENISHLFDKYNPVLLNSFQGLAKLWKLLSEDLKEKDPVDIDKTTHLLRYFYAKVEPLALDFINQAIASTKERVTEVINAAKA